MNSVTAIIVSCVMGVSCCRERYRQPRLNLLQVADVIADPDSDCHDRYIQTTYVHTGLAVTGKPWVPWDSRGNGNGNVDVNGMGM